MYEFPSVEPDAPDTGADVNRLLEERDRRARSRRVAVVVAGTAGLCIVGMAFFHLWRAQRMPRDAPLPMMYRTEAQMQSLVTAIAKYRKIHNEYPPSGIEGQRAAVDALNATVVYLTELPRDAWGRHFVYVRAGDYSDEGTGAVRDRTRNEFYNPDTYQIYSIGMDAAWARDDDPADPRSPNRDNVNNWDHSRSWRKTYHDRQREYRRRSTEAVPAGE